jgi:hypothetical protein
MSTITDQDAQQIADRFKRETADHQLTVLHDHDGYRHLRYEDPQRIGNHRFDLITWPNGMTIRADGPTFTLSLYPTADLFDMVRGSSHDGGINPGYWQELVRAGKLRDWSQDKFCAWLTAKAAADEAAHPGLSEAVREQILESDEHNLEYEDGARTAVAWFDHDGYELRFPAGWEQSFDDWSWEWLWACHALVRGIAEYDRVNAAATT